MSERLQKFLASAGVASRRKSEDLITAGRVTVNGTKAALGQKVSPGDEVAVDGTAIAKPGETVTYMLHKPPGYLSSVSDNRGRPTVIELVPRAPGLHPVGRLDLDSEGLLLLSNDGALTLQLTHPRFEHEKSYRVWCRQGTLGAGELGILEGGVKLEDGLARAVVAKVAEGGCYITLKEGRNHQVRRMLAAVGYSVTRLVRERVGGLELGDLPRGKYRKLSKQDLTRLGYTRQSER